MVFFETGRRHRRKDNKDAHKTDTQPPSFTLDSLPEEIRLIIFATLSTDELLNLRLVSPIIIRSCNTELKTRLKILYIHPSPAAMKRVIRLCEHPCLPLGVEEVCVLGRVDWHAMNWAWEDYRHRGRKARTPGVSKSQIVREMAFRFKTWPMRFADDVAREQKNSDPIPAFEDAYRPLIAALHKLPKLKKISFARSSDRPGLNQVSSEKIGRLAMEAADIPERKWTCHPRACSPYPVVDPIPRRAHRSDAEILYSLLLQPALHFTELSLPTEMPFCEDIPRLALLDSINPPAQKFSAQSTTALKIIRNLKLSMDCQWPSDCPQRKLLRGIIWSARFSLEHLDIDLVINSSQWRITPDFSLCSILGANEDDVDFDFPVLKSFTVRALRPIRPAHHKERTYRPCIHEGFDIVSFLERHAPTLTHVSFQNVLFPTRAHPNPLDTIRAICSVIHRNTPSTQDPHTHQHHERLHTDSKSAATCVNSVKPLCAFSACDFSYTLQHFLHDPRCRNEDSEAFRSERCQYHPCGVYLTSVPIEVQDVEAFATASRVGFDNGPMDRGWEFAACFKERDEEEW